jgi:ornithine decarboxylase
VVNQQRVINQWNLWNTHLPQVKPYYAVKCNSDSNILTWLSQLGSGFDCASGREMEACRFMAFDKGGPIHERKTVFANPCKTPQDIEIARSRSVPWATIDSCEELEKMKDALYQPELLLRVAVDDAASDTPFSKKFGLGSWDEVLRLYDAARGFGFNVCGFAFHVGSGCRDYSQYKRALGLVDSMWGKLKAKGAKDLHTIDIGGGFRAGESYFVGAAEAIKGGIAELDAAKGANLIAEPGRFFATPSHDLFVRVIGKKPGVGGKGWRYTLDESVYGQFSCIPFDGQKPPFAIVGRDMKTRSKVPGVMFGRTCDSLDVVCFGAEMDELFVGDWLYFPWMGAYTTVTSSEFNGFPKPTVIYTSEFIMPETYYWPGSINGELQWQTGIEYALEVRSKI